jgi:uncharacterized C2H2 Zn-finger protein
MAKTANSLNCPKCSFVGKSEQSLKVHTALAHKRGAGKKKAQRKTAAASKPVRRRRGVRCPRCGKILKTPAALKTHTTRMHKGLKKSGPGRPKKRGRPAAAKTGRGSTLDRKLMSLSLAEVADLHAACRKELARRLSELV